jgi:hypothetical protein
VLVVIVVVEEEEVEGVCGFWGAGDMRRVEGRGQIWMSVRGPVRERAMPSMSRA